MDDAIQHIRRNELFKKAKPPRVHIKRESSKYYNQVGFIIFSYSTGQFNVMVDVEGYPELILRPDEVDPC